MEKEEVLSRELDQKEREDKFVLENHTKNERKINENRKGKRKKREKTKKRERESNWVKAFFLFCSGVRERTNENLLRWIIN